MIPFPTNPNFPSVTCMHGIKKIIWNGHGYRQSHWVRLTVTVCILQSWALAHFFEVRYPLPTQFFPLDRWRSCVHFLNFLFRSSLKRSSLNQWFAERKGLNHSSLSIIVRNVGCFCVDRKSNKHKTSSQPPSKIFWAYVQLWAYNYNFLNTLFYNRERWVIQLFFAQRSTGWATSVWATSE